MKTRFLLLSLAALLVIPAMLAGCSTSQPTPSQPSPANTPAANINSGGDQAAFPAPDASGNSSQATVAAALATATNLSGPGAGGSGDGIDVSKVDACALLTQADIEAIMGPVNYKPDAPQARSAQKNRCDYVQEIIHDLNNIEGKEVGVVIWPVADWEMQKVVSGNGAPSVAGVGDEAFTDDYPNLLALWVLDRSKALIEIHVFPKDVEKAKKLALKVIEHLP